MTQHEDDLDSAQPSRETVIGQGIAWTARWSLRWLVIAGAVVVLGFVVGQIWGVLLPVLLALIIVTMLEAPARLLREKARFPRALAAAVVVLGAVAVVVGILVAIAPALAGQFGDVADNASSGLQRVQDFLQSNNFVSKDQIDKGIQALQDRLQSSASSIATGILVGVTAVSSALVTLLLTLVLAFFFLKDGHRFLPWLRGLSGDTAGDHVSEVLLRSWNTLGGFIRAQALVGAADAVLIGTGLLVVGVPVAVPLAILTFFGGFVPVIGAVAVGALAVLVTLVSNGFVAALIVLGVILAVQQIEGNVLQPVLQGRTMHLHAGVILLAVVLGSTLFGVVGAFLAVPVVAVLAVVARYLDEVATSRAAPRRSGGPSRDEERDDDGTEAKGGEDAESSQPDHADDTDAGTERAPRRPDR